MRVNDKHIVSNNMKKTVLLAIVSTVSMFFVSCDRKKESDYKTYENEKFTVEYPKTWDLSIDENPFRPFATYSEDLMVALATRLQGGISLDSFVEERIQSFEKTQWGFRLIDKKVEGSEAIIHYVNESEDLKLGTTMRIIANGDFFYGIDGTYETPVQKDTLEHIISSLNFK